MGPEGFDNGINSAILRYNGAPKFDPTTTQMSSVLPLQETNLHPLSNPGTPGQPIPGGFDISFNLLIARDRSSQMFTINGASFQPPTVPVLLQILSGTRNASELLPKGSVYPLPPNKLIEVSIPGGTSGAPVSCSFMIKVI
jgi:iron transport multicopper oxidase